jgi:hypothetical protein
MIVETEKLKLLSPYVKKEDDGIIITSSQGTVKAYITSNSSDIKCKVTIGKSESPELTIYGDKKLASIFSKLSEPEVTIEKQNNRIVIKQKKSKYAVPENEFVREVFKDIVDVFEKIPENNISIPNTTPLEFSELIKIAAQYAEKDGVGVLSCVLWKVDNNGKGLIAAADRTTMFLAEYQDNNNKSFQLQIPIKQSILISNFISKFSPSRVFFNQNFVAFYDEDKAIISPLMYEEYPDFSHILELVNRYDASFDTIIKVSRADIVDVFRSAPSQKNVFFEIQVSSNQATIRNTNMGTDEEIDYEINIPCEILKKDKSGNSRPISFDAFGKLAQKLNFVKEFIICFNSKEEPPSPVVFKAEGDTLFSVVTMPVIKSSEEVDNE